MLRRFLSGRVLSPALIAALAVFLSAGAVALARELLIVTQREAALRKEKKLLSPKVAVVREGDQVEKLGEEGSWLRVAFDGKEGWLPVSSVSSDRKVVLSGEAVASGVRATEQSAGSRGFNPQVEAQHRAGNTSLNEAYRIVDFIQGRKFAEEKIARFVSDGKLGEAVASADAAPNNVERLEPVARQRAPWSKR